MKIFWQAQVRRIDALTLRERAIMFVSVAVAMVAAADALVLSPGMAEHKRIAQEARASNAALQSLRERLREPADDASPAGQRTRELAALRAEQRHTEEQIAGLTASARGTRLPELLERVLRRHERLTLLRLVASPTAAPAQPGGLPLQAVEVALRGSYADLTQYLADAEASMPGLRWGEITVSAPGSGATELSARVSLLGALR